MSAPGRAQGLPTIFRDRFLTLPRRRAPISRVHEPDVSTALAVPSASGRREKKHGRLPRDEHRRPRGGRGTTGTRKPSSPPAASPARREALRADGRAGPRAAAAPRLRARRAGPSRTGREGLIVTREDVVLTNRRGLRLHASFWSTAKTWAKTGATCDPASQCVWSRRRRDNFYA